MSDLIKREDAIKAIEDRRCWLTLASQHGDMGRVLWDEYYIKFEDAIEALLLISSADRPQGEWILIFNDPLRPDFKCSKCLKLNSIASHYCPNCGANMERENDERTQK